MNLRLLRRHSREEILLLLLSSRASSSILLLSRRSAHMSRQRSEANPRESELGELFLRVRIRLG